MDNIIYMDASASAPIEKEVYDATLPFLYEEFGNPSGLYSVGYTARDAIRNARQNIAKSLNANPDGIYFTSGATESNNWIIKNVALKLFKNGFGNHIITTQIEHKSVLNTCHYLEEEYGFNVTYLPVDKYGLVSVNDFKNAITEDTVLASVMYVNNEIGTIEPIKNIADICNDYNIHFHVDAVQAFGKIPIDVRALGIDYLTASAHKIGGLCGTGIVYSFSFDALGTYIHGGHQEYSKRGGTENVIGIVSMGKAAELTTENMKTNFEKINANRHYLLYGLLQIQGSHLNGAILDHDRLYNNINIRFDGVSGTALQAMLAEKGICVSVGSACNNGENTPSHVLKAIGLSDKQCNESLRITLSHHNTIDECIFVLHTIRDCVDFLRKIN